MAARAGFVLEKDQIITALMVMRHSDSIRVVACSPSLQKSE